MRTQIIVLFALVAFCSADMNQFKEFMNKFSKNYESNAEMKLRYNIFKDNLKVIDRLNARNSTATFGVTKFADLSREEFIHWYSGSDMKPAFQEMAKTAPMARSYTDEEIAALPKIVDWRTKGAVTEVKNQGGCGSCWSFSSTGNLEGQWFLAGNKLVGLSEQNLVDCDHTCINGTCDAGCAGGLMPNAWTYILNNGGIDTEASYPYVGEDGTCNFNKANVGATVKGYTMIPGNETQMAAWCAQNGPISIAVDASDWQFYYFGIFEFPWCGTQLDHGVLLVGFSHQTDWIGQDTEFWWVKNSWGADWGYSGYIKLARGSNQCGDNLFPCSSVV